MSKVILNYFGFTLLRSVIGLEISRHLLNQSDAKLKPIAACIGHTVDNKTTGRFIIHGHTRFPALEAGYVYLLWVLIGSLWYLRLFWLAVVITLVLVLRHSIQKRSIMCYSLYAA